MPEVIKLRKGLDIKLKGTAAKELVPVKASAQYALVPDDFTGVTPKVVVSEGQIVKAGEPDEIFARIEKTISPLLNRKEQWLMH